MSDKRTQIIEASIDLFATNGFWNTPTSKITKHAGVSTGTLFNYFESKEVLIDEVYVQLRHEQFKHVTKGYPKNGSMKEQMEHAWFRYIDWGTQFPVRYRLLFQMKLSDMVSSEAYQRTQLEAGHSLGEIIQKGVSEGMFGDISKDLFIRLLFAQLNAAVDYAVDEKLTDMRLTKHITQTFNIFWMGFTK